MIISKTQYFLKVNLINQGLLIYSKINHPLKSINLMQMTKCKKLGGFVVVIYFFKEYNKKM